jgi:hypothetical protein
LARKKCKGAKLEVFSNKAATLNRLIFELLRAKKELATYDAYLEVRRIKGFKHTKLQTVDARMKKLLQQRLIVKKGTKKTQPGTRCFTIPTKQPSGNSIRTRQSQYGQVPYGS